MLCHYVPIVLSGPSWRAAGLSWDHDYSWSSRHIAHSTRYIVMIFALYRTPILRTINIGMSLHSISVCEGGVVLWVLRHAQVVGSTSSLGQERSSCDA